MKSSYLAALGLAIAVPVALATPALAKPSAAAVIPSVSSVLQQREDFRAEVTYLCSTPEREGTINVYLQQSGKPVGTGTEEAKCDGKTREDKVKIPVVAGAVDTTKPVWVLTSLVVYGKEIVVHATQPVTVTAVVPNPTPSPTTTTVTPTSSPSPSEDDDSASPSPSPVEDSLR